VGFVGVVLASLELFKLLGARWAPSKVGGLRPVRLCSVGFVCAPSGLFVLRQIGLCSVKVGLAPSKFFGHRWSCLSSVVAGWGYLGVV
jgi:hypothetical protein